MKDRLAAIKAYFADKWKRIVRFFIGRKSGTASPPVDVFVGKEDYSSRLRDACALLPCTDEELSKVNWAAMDVMVGTVRTYEQLVFNLQHGNYYAPACFMPENQPPVKYIVLHEEEIGVEPGIRCCGEVKTTAIVKRGGIGVAMRENTDPNERYFYFLVHGWEELPQVIEIFGSSRGRPRFTNRFLLEHCRKSYQLFAISSEEDYRLMRELNKAFEKLPASAAGVAVHRVNEHRCFYISEGFIVVTDNEGEVLDKISLRSFAENPSFGFGSIKRVVMDL